jgi:hypothetical protein
VPRRLILDGSGLTELRSALAPQEIKPVTVIYESELGSRADHIKTGKVNQSHVERKARQKRQTTRIVIDIEAWTRHTQWPGKRDYSNYEAEVRKEIKKLAEVSHQWKGVAPTDSVCIYGYPSRQSAWLAIESGETEKWLEIQSLIAKELTAVDYLCASGYVVYDDPVKNDEVWRLMAKAASEVYKKPLYLFIWHRNPVGRHWWNTLTYKYFLERAHVHAAGIIVWASADERDSHRFIHDRVIERRHKDQYHASRSGQSTNAMLRTYKRYKAKNFQNYKPENEAQWIKILDDFMSEIREQ